MIWDITSQPTFFLSHLICISLSLSHHSLTLSNLVHSSGFTYYVPMEFPACRTVPALHAHTADSPLLTCTWISTGNGNLIPPKWSLSFPPQTLLFLFSPSQYVAILAETWEASCTPPNPSFTYIHSLTNPTGSNFLQSICLHSYNNRIYTYGYM